MRGSLAHRHARGPPGVARKFGPHAVSRPRTGGLPERDLDLTRGRGVDGALYGTATDSDAPVRDAARIARKRAEYSVGVAGLRLARADFYAKDSSCRCAAVTARPLRSGLRIARRDTRCRCTLTEQRNFEAVLELLATAAERLNRLVSHRFAFDRPRTPMRPCSTTRRACHSPHV